MPFVVDNSVIAGWHFRGQATPYTEAALDQLVDDIAHAPAVWPLEFSNVIRKALTGRKIDETRAQEILRFQAELSVVVHGGTIDPAENLALALRHGLSSYDAAYLDLALRLQLPIATQDAALRNAAMGSGVGVWKK